MKKKEKEIIVMAAKFQQALKIGSDGTCTSIAASFLESQLESLLKSKLIGDLAFKYEIFDFRQPLGTFSAKTMLAYSTGIISDKTMKTLQFIDALNKEFERDYIGFSFDNSPLTEQVYQLTSSAYLKYEVSPRRYFNNAALTALLLIHTGYKMKKFKEKIEPVITDTERKEIMKNLENIVGDFLQLIQSN